MSQLSQQYGKSEALWSFITSCKWLSCEGQKIPENWDFKPGVLLQPLNITTLLQQDKEAKLKRGRDSPHFVGVLIKAGNGLLKILGGPILQTFLGSLCPALL